MSIEFSSHSLASVLGVLNVIEVPAFVLTVDGSGAIRFGGLNRAHEARTGIRSDDIAGLTPHEALPPRMADTVLANYTHCAETGETYRYEEVLDLPSGRIWWKTTLSPIVERGRTTTILGLATDVTTLRSEIADVTADLGELRTQADCLRTLGQAVVSETRGPLNNIIALGQLLRAEFHPPTGKMEEVLDLMIDTASGALGQIDGFETESETAPSPCFRTFARVDLDHACRDIAALVDPDRKLSITFPEGAVLADAHMLESTLEALLDAVARRATSYIHVSLTPDARKLRMIRMRIIFDQTGAAKSDDFAWLRATVEARGGALQIERCGLMARENAEVIDLSLPGKLLAPAGQVNLARAVNQRQTGPASG